MLTLADVEYTKKDMEILISLLSDRKSGIEYETISATEKSTLMGCSERIQKMIANFHSKNRMLFDVRNTQDQDY